MAETVRADARRNRERIVQAASACFAADGLECQMTAIAKKAGVGSATVFRHFAAKHDLAVAVFEERMRTTEAFVAEQATNPDPAAGLRSVLEHFVVEMVSDRGLKQAVGEGMFEDPELACRQEEVLASVDELLRRCRETGGVADDVELTDLIVLAQGVAQAAGPLEARSPGAWRRFLALALRGVLTGTEGDLPAAPSTADVMGAAHGAG